jgi:acyl-CoA synthetase (AMP-forming)/AMP-acid ligase II/pimeloyl-ACP methyl ester carboxylesterase
MPDHPEVMLQRDAGEAAVTLGALLRRHAACTPTSACILSATGEELPWRGLVQQLDHTRAILRARGLGPDARVALVMGNGPLLATAFLSVASATACAPLNPAYGPDEFTFYLEDIKAAAVIVSPDVAAAASTAAAKLGIPVLEVVPDDSAPGLFDLAGAASDAALPSDPGADSVALLLHTSGTTSRPKLVPLRHSNLLASARNMGRTLALSAADRCLDLMPLFHIHGLVGGLLAPLAAGGSAVCAPSFRPDAFLAWHDATRPTWYTAVPTMHRVIAAEAAGRDLTGSRLRFIRSSSAPMPASLFEELVAVFGVPVTEAYSMTEAAHQMTCNPLEPGAQKPGTVGLPAGPEVALLDDHGRVLPPGATGEIAIRGASVMNGYEANPAANADAFVDGWFRTGDQGRLDADGYLVLTGRLKEQINRGGEKISPFEIDTALLRHPEVAEAVAFAFPHPTLGEEIAAAVVLRPHARATADDLQTFLRAGVAPFKMPKRILTLKQIPKGPTGKIQRRQMAALLGMDGSRPQPAADTAAADGLEAELLALFRDTLKDTTVGPGDDFFERGGDSLMAMQMQLELERITGRSLPESLLLDHPTARRLARGLSEAARTASNPMIRVQTHGTKPPIFFFHGDYTGGYFSRRLARLLGDDQPFFSIAPHAFDVAPSSIELMAVDRLPLLLNAHPSGPFRLAGYCNGGMVALECARLLRESGREVALVALIDTPPFNFRPAMRGMLRLLDAVIPVNDGPLSAIADIAWRQVNNLQQRSLSAYATDIVDGLWRHLHVAPVRKILVPLLRTRPLPEEFAVRAVKQAKIYNRLFRRYVPDKIDLPVVYYSATYRRGAIHRLGPNTTFVSVPGGHWGCVTTHADVLVSDWRARLEACEPLVKRSLVARRR